MLEDKVQELIASYKQKALDGMTIKEIIHFIFEITSVLTQEAQTLLGIPKEDRAEVIAMNISRVYKAINPNIPKISEPFETWIENFVLDYIVPAAIKWIDK